MKSPDRRSVILAFLFDFGNVICSFEPARFVTRLSQLTGEPPAGLGTSLRQSSELFVRYETGLLSSEEFFAGICSACRISVSREEFVHAYTNIFTPIPSTFDLLRSLKRHYRLGLISNTSEWHFEHAIRPIEIFGLFDSVTLSFRVKAMKPAKEIYTVALSDLRVKPQQCIYIDDLPENVEGARACGMIALRYTTPEGLLQALRSLDIHLDPAGHSHG